MKPANKVLVLVGPNSKDWSDQEAQLGRGVLPVLTAGKEAGADILDNSGYGSTFTQIVARTRGNITQLERTHRPDTRQYTTLVLVGTQDQRLIYMTQTFAREVPTGKVIHLTGWDDEPKGIEMPDGFGYKILPTRAAPTINSVIREALGVAPKAAGPNPNPQASERRPFLKAASVQGEASA